MLHICLVLIGGNGGWGTRPKEISGIEYWDTHNLRNTKGMFYTDFRYNTDELLDLSKWDTSNLEDISGMFAQCYYKEINLSGWNTSNVTNMQSMFELCDYLQNLDLSGWNTSNVTNMGYMYRTCFSLTSILVGQNWTTTQADITGMFDECGTSEVTRK